jgi:hypothetical protein
VGAVCAGGRYRGYWESRTGEVACGGLFGGYYVSKVGKACTGAQRSTLATPLLIRPMPRP